MGILDNHSAFNNMVVRNGIKIYENTSVRSYIMSGKIKKAVHALYASFDSKYGSLEKYKREFFDSTGKRLPGLDDLEARIDRMPISKMEHAMNALYDSGIEECMKVMVNAAQKNKKEETEEPLEPIAHPFGRRVIHHKVKK